MSRADEYWGKGDPEAMFGKSPLTVSPWPPAGRRKDVKDYDEGVVHEAVRRGETESVDPRNLRSTQPHVTYAGVKHYMESDEVYKDQDQAGNKHPVVYDRNGQQMLLSGHHRAAAHLLRGEQFDAVVARGGWGPPRGSK